ncbi:Phenylacetaldehyde reductase [Rhynchospora pubera]|uniref:Phenylacetaldehyde reductase n=1 Tax=Rhynchospora pubera TaxID=906938 RepID=A0AAV8FQ07_9POAL|nr:Phenylacetaldehyde reductase [Rhynchospora pubera]
MEPLRDCTCLRQIYWRKDLLTLQLKVVMVFSTLRLLAKLLLQILRAELIDPAVNGTLNVLRSCSKYPSIKRIVVTSSINAVTYNGKPLNSDVMVDEAWFSSPKFCEQSQLWYHLSKTLAEEAAWKFSKENGLDMVVINPGIIIGPLLQPTLNATSAIILNLINGSTTFPNSLVRSVNVKDVAMAHILAYEVPSANGRYCLVESIYHVSEVVEIIRQLYPAFRLPDKCEDDKPFQSTYQVSKEKARTLGMSFIPFQIGITEIIESLKERGFVTLS